jgi:uncharacterized repeat protein (TIGR04138 family)
MGRSYGRRRDRHNRARRPSDPAECRPVSPRNEITPILARDARYSIEAYALVLEALDHATRRARRPRAGKPARRRHVTGRQLCLAARELVLERYGLLAPDLLGRWGIRSSADLGEIVYALIASGDLTKTDRDARSDFDGVFHVDGTFLAGYSVFGRESEAAS